MLATMLLGQPVPLLPYQLCERRAGVRRTAAAVFKMRRFCCITSFCTCDATRFHVHVVLAPV
uniref:Uncharacterized protein n=1 Tax=Arundo donax TaxID=35708 RepID=A0A0A9GGJ9_ARUDO